MMKGLANVGDTLAGKYRVDKILGIGGMGMVVQAMHLDLDQRVALKFMLPQALESPEASARFLREARAAGRLTGEHICRVIDVGRFESGAPYIVMEYLEGYDLGTLLKRRGPLPIAEAIDYILQACEGMAEAHALAIVHRDLKPDNLFLATRVDGGRLIKVLDFGISKATVTGLATKTGDILGSPAYMAPEQMQATKDVDARADIWSLGGVLHQLLSGKTPFAGDTLPGLCLAVMNQPAPSLVTLRKDVPPPLAEAVLKCLAKRRDDRFTDVSDLAQAIAPFGPAGAVGAVTRVRSLLRGRATPTTLPPTEDDAHRSSQGVAPTLVERDGFLPTLTPSAPFRLAADSGARGATTLAASAGESLAMPRVRRIPLGVMGAVLGTLAMVALIIVMVMRRDDAGEPRAATVPAATPVTQPPPPPVVAPVVADPVQASVAPVVADPVSAVDPPVTSGSAVAPHVAKDEKDPRAKKPKRDATAVPADAGATPVDAADDEDKWGRMLHDHDKPPPSSPSPSSERDGKPESP